MYTPLSSLESLESRQLLSNSVSVDSKSVDQHNLDECVIPLEGLLLSHTQDVLKKIENCATHIYEKTFEVLRQEEGTQKPFLMNTYEAQLQYLSLELDDVGDAILRKHRFGEIREFIKPIDSENNDPLSRYPISIKICGKSKDPVISPSSMVGYVDFFSTIFQLMKNMDQCFSEKNANPEGQFTVECFDNINDFAEKVEKIGSITIVELKKISERIHSNKFEMNQPDCVSKVEEVFLKEGYKSLIKALEVLWGIDDAIVRLSTFDLCEQDTIEYIKWKHFNYLEYTENFVNQWNDLYTGKSMFDHGQKIGEPLKIIYNTSDHSLLSVGYDEQELQSQNSIRLCNSFNIDPLFLEDEIVQYTELFNSIIQFLKNWPGKVEAVCVEGNEDNSWDVYQSGINEGRETQEKIVEIIGSSLEKIGIRIGANALGKWLYELNRR